jgi:hypothetical protein
MPANAVAPIKAIFRLGFFWVAEAGRVSAAAAVVPGMTMA